METTLKFARTRTDLARNHFRPVMTALELARPFGRVEIDDWAEDLNECLRATGLMPPKAWKTMSAARLSVRVTTCIATRMILALEVSSNVHAKFDLKSPDEASPDGRCTAVPACAGGIPDVLELIKTDDDNAFFATAAFNQLINQEDF